MPDDPAAVAAELSSAEVLRETKPPGGTEGHDRHWGAFYRKAALALAREVQRQKQEKRTAGQTLVEHVGADGPMSMSIEAVADRAVAEITRLLPYEQAVRKAHNGYDPEARLVMPTLEEPKSPSAAISELLFEQEEIGILQGRMESEAEITRLRDESAGKSGLIQDLTTCLKNRNAEITRLREAFIEHAYAAHTDGRIYAERYGAQGMSGDDVRLVGRRAKAAVNATLAAKGASDAQ